MLRYVIGISVITLTLTVVRSLAKRKISKRLQYAMWLLIPIYMIAFPFLSFEIDLPQTEINEIQAEEVYLTDGVPHPIDASAAIENASQGIPQRTINWPKTLENIAVFVSKLCLVAVGIYNVVFVVWIRSRRVFIEYDPVSGLRTYKINSKSAPFLLGNEIYLSDRVIDENRRKYIICHEYCHYKHGDFIWMILRLVVVALIWYNPLIWYACGLAEQDCEMACDEAVLHLVGEDKNIEYGKVLISFLSEEGYDKPMPGVMATMNGRGKKIMKDRIENIKRPVTTSTKTLLMISLITIIVTGCSLIEFNEPETSVTSEVIAETTETEATETEKEPDETTLATEETASVVEETLEITETQWKIPDIGEMENGLYTVSMTPLSLTEADGDVTQVFFPWDQVTYDQAEIDSWYVGENIDIPEGFVPENSVTITHLDQVIVEPQNRMGTSYTGAIIYLEDNDGINVRKTVDGDWKMFCWEHPVYVGYQPMRLPISKNVKIYDAYHPIINCETIYMTPEEVRDLIEFKDTTLTEGKLKSVNEFFDSMIQVTIQEGDNYNVSTSTQKNHEFTVIEVNNDQITAVWFWYVD